MSERIDTSDICRFCLSISSFKMNFLTDQMLQTINACFSLQINILESLPKQICDVCNNKISLLCEFREAVYTNEKLLYETFTKGQNELNRLFSQFKRTKIKEEVVKSDLNDYEVNNFRIDQEVFDQDSAIPENNVTTNEFSSILEETNSKNDVKETIDPDCIEEPENNPPNLENDSNSYDSLKFKCLTCDQTYNSKCLLLNHYNKDHFVKPKENNSQVKFEVETTSQGKVYKCSACTKVYYDKKSISRHIHLGHTNARPFLCKMCGRTYKTASAIVRHGRVHNGKHLFCSHQCGFSTVYDGALKEHERRHDASDFKYKCEKCNKGFHVKTWYIQHQNIHTGVKPFVCDICGVAFHMDRYLTSHRSSVHPQTSNLKRYVCVHCSLRCDSRHALTEHLKEHGMMTEKKSLCDLCGKILSNGEQLKFHKRMHLGVKPYTCSICNKSFAKKFNLQLHERGHSGDKTHVCRCGRRYTQRSALLRHHARHHSDAGKLNHSNVKTFPAPASQATQETLCT